MAAVRSGDINNAMDPALAPTRTSTINQGQQPQLPDSQLPATRSVLQDSGWQGKSYYCAARADASEKPPLLGTQAPVTNNGHVAYGVSNNDGQNSLQNQLSNHQTIYTPCGPSGPPTDDQPDGVLSRLSKQGRHDNQLKKQLKDSIKAKNASSIVGALQQLIQRKLQKRRTDRDFTTNICSEMCESRALMEIDALYINKIIEHIRTLPSQPVINVRHYTDPEYTEPSYGQEVPHTEITAIKNLYQELRKELPCSVVFGKELPRIEKLFELKLEDTQYETLNSMLSEYYAPPTYEHSQRQKMQRLLLIHNCYIQRQKLQWQYHVMVDVIKTNKELNEKYQAQWETHFKKQLQDIEKALQECVYIEKEGRWVDNSKKIKLWRDEI